MVLSEDADIHLVHHNDLPAPVFCCCCFCCNTKKAYTSYHKIFSIDFNYIINAYILLRFIDSDILSFKGHEKFLIKQILSLAEKTKRKTFVRGTISSEKYVRSYLQNPNICIVVTWRRISCPNFEP